METILFLAPTFFFEFHILFSIKSIPSLPPFLFVSFLPLTNSTCSLLEVQPTDPPTLNCLYIQMLGNDHSRSDPPFHTQTPIPLTIILLSPTPTIYHNFIAMINDTLSNTYFLILWMLCNWWIRIACCNCSMQVHAVDNHNHWKTI